MEIPNRAYITLYEALKIKFISLLPPGKQKLVLETDFTFWVSKNQKNDSKTYFELYLSKVAKSPKHFYNKYRDALTALANYEKALSDEEGFQIEKDHALIAMLSEFLEIPYPKQITDPDTLSVSVKAKMLFQVFIETHEPNHLTAFPFLRVFDRISGKISDENGKNQSGKKSGNQKNIKKEVKNASLKTSDMPIGVIEKPPTITDNPKHEAFKIDGKSRSVLDPDVRKEERAEILKRLKLTEKDVVQQVEDLIKKYYQYIQYNDYSQAFYLWTEESKQYSIDKFRELIRDQEFYQSRLDDNAISSINVLNTNISAINDSRNNSDSVTTKSRIYFEEFIKLPIPIEFLELYKQGAVEFFETGTKAYNDFVKKITALNKRAIKAGIQFRPITPYSVYDLTFIINCFRDNGITKIRYLSDIFNISNKFQIHWVLDVTCHLKNGSWLIAEIQIVQPNSTRTPNSFLFDDDNQNLNYHFIG